MCPTGWFVETQDAPDYLTTHAGAGARARRVEGRDPDDRDDRSSWPIPWNADDELLAPLRERFPDARDRRPAVPRPVRPPPARRRGRAHRRRARGVGRRRWRARPRSPRADRPSSRRTCAGSRRSAPASTTSTTSGLPDDVHDHQRRRRRRGADRRVRDGAAPPGLEAAARDRRRNRREHDWKPKFGRTVEGLTIGIIGLGAIGTAVAVRARAFGMTVIGTRRSYKEGQHARRGRRAARRRRPPRRPRRAATRSWSARRATPDTENLFDAAAFAAMKPGALFCNVGRGSLVDEPALIAALESGHLGAAHPRRHPRASRSPPTIRLWSAPNIYISPHCVRGAGPLHREAVRAVRRQPRAATRVATRCATSSTAPPGTDCERRRRDLPARRCRRLPRGRCRHRGSRACATAVDGERSTPPLSIDLSARWPMPWSVRTRRRRPAGSVPRRHRPLGREQPEFLAFAATRRCPASSPSCSASDQVWLYEDSVLVKEPGHRRAHRLPPGPGVLPPRRRPGVHGVDPARRGRRRERRGALRARLAP